MRYLFPIRLAIAAVMVAAAGQLSSAVTLEFAGSQYNLGGNVFPGGTPPCCIVPWRSDGPSNVFAVSDQSPNRYYGTAGYALFATMFTYPDMNIGYSSTVEDPIFANNDFYIDILDLPDFVADSQILAARKAGGWAYALIDDPRLQAGIRHWTFDGTNYPPSDGTNTTGGIPYVKLGLLNGSDIFGNNPGVSPTARWGFEVGENAPAKFRVGVITDGLDANHFAAAEVFLTHVVDEMPGTTVSSGEVVRNRFVDMHFFDIIGAQPGDQFVFSSMRSGSDPDFTSGGISGFTFDVFPELPGIPGDYNGDGFVDAADYTVWRNNLGGDASAFETGTRDPNNSGDINSDDYDFWKSQYGMSGGSGGLAAVPEPVSMTLVALGLVVASCCRTTQRRSVRN